MLCGKCRLPTKFPFSRCYSLEAQATDTIIEERVSRKRSREECGTHDKDKKAKLQAYYKDFYEQRREQILAKRKERYQQQKSVVLAREKEKYHEQREEILQRQKMKYWEDPSIKRGLVKKYREENKEKEKERHKIYNQNNQVKNKERKLRYASNFSAEALSKKSYKEIFEADLNITEPEDWYHVTKQDINKNMELKQFVRFLGLPQLLAILYPDEEWIFASLNISDQLRKKCFEDPIQVRRFLETLESPLYITKPSDWQEVSDLEFRKVARGLYEKYSRSLMRILMAAYPSRDWKRTEYMLPPKKMATQRFIKRMISVEMNIDEAEENFFHPRLNTGNKKVSVDIWIPELNLAIEYQGEPHYHDLNFSRGKDKYAVLDATKRKLCQLNNINLVEVPYWWDRSWESLHLLVMQESHGR